MVGFSHQIQVRHIVVPKEEVATLLKGTLDEVENEQARIKMLMRLAEKYSTCVTKDDGGNLGWIELGSDDPRIRHYDPVLKNHELEQIIREGIKSLKILKGKVHGPVKTDEGYHLVLVAQEFGEENVSGFTGSAL